MLGVRFSFETWAAGQAALRRDDCYLSNTPHELGSRKQATPAALFGGHADFVQRFEVRICLYLFTEGILFSS